MNQATGVVMGVVKDINDPQGQSRIRVQFPWLSDDELSAWAPICRPMAGAGRGQFFMPELEDEALVAFEHGDFDHPVVLGFLHNGSDKQPDSGGPSVRRLKTVSGHVLEFCDSAGSERILVKTAGGQSIELEDTTASITIQTVGGTSIKVDDISGVTVNCLTAAFTAIAGFSVTAPSVSINAPIATFAGVVECEALISQAIVSAVYNNGPGNLI